MVVNQYEHYLNVTTETNKQQILQMPSVHRPQEDFNVYCYDEVLFYILRVQALSRSLSLTISFKSAVCPLRCLSISQLHF